VAGDIERHLQHATDGGIIVNDQDARTRCVGGLTRYGKRGRRF
jgi:hypothetical protein